jgi:predicted amidophosphoribosyltransferase
VIESVLDLLAPPLCWSCGAPAARASPLCRSCRGRLRFLPRAPVALSGIEVWAPVAYDGPARDLVTALKFHGATRLAEQMAALIVANAPAGLIGGPAAGGTAAGAASAAAAPAGAASAAAVPAAAGPALVPVPLHRARRIARPYNQALLIAEAIFARTHLPIVDCLRRVGDDRRQVGRGRAARLTAPGAAEAVVRAPPDVLLVDDVVTTGGTLVACAHALRSAGAQHVTAIAFARTAGR